MTTDERPEQPDQPDQLDQASPTDPVSANDEGAVPDHAGRGMSRRRFLVGAGAGAGAVVLGAASRGSRRDPTLLDPKGLERLLDFHRLAPTRSANSADGPVLVLVTLYGGNDGLNTVVPLDSTAYTKARGNMALAPSSLLPLDSDYGLHAGMPGFRKLWKEKRLAIIQGVGYPDPNLSHFQSMDIWQGAVLSGDSNTGWLGRWLDMGTPDPLQAIVIGPLVPLALRGADSQASAILPPPIILPGKAAIHSAYATMQVPVATDALLAQEVAGSGQQFLSIQKQLAPVLDRRRFGSNALTQAGGSPTNIEGSSSNPVGAVDLAQGGGSVGVDSILADQLNLVAAMVQADLPIKVYSVSLGGFDTHAAQLQTHSTLLAQLDSGVSGFLKKVGGNPSGRPVVVFIYSEFGRRVPGNGSLGTDHGEAGVAFVAGDSVAGGYYGAAPSLTNLDQGNLISTTDFRSVYATVLESVIGTEASPILSASFPTLGFVS